MTTPPAKPAPKQIKMTLTWGTHNQYQVKTITNSTAYKPEEWLDVDVVTKLCSDEYPNWDISMANDKTMQQILGMVSSHVALPTL
jgi:hypothetical protein